MAFRPPTFNIKCNVWQGQAGVAPPVGPPDISMQDCQLRSPGHAYNGTAQGIGGSFGYAILEVPAGTDLRDDSNASSNSIVEVPAGTGRFYQCMYVDDTARGFTNEYRYAMLIKAGQWPTPIP